MTKPNVLVSLITHDNDYQMEQAAAAEDAARRLDANIQIVYAGNDAVNQSQQLLKVIQGSPPRPDAILVEPVATGMPRVAGAAVVPVTEISYRPRSRPRRGGTRIDQSV